MPDADRDKGRVGQRNNGSAQRRSQTRQEVAQQMRCMRGWSATTSLLSSLGVRCASVCFSLALCASPQSIYSANAVITCVAESTITVTGTVKRTFMDTTQTVWAITFNQPTDTPCVVSAIILNSINLPTDCKIGNSATATGRVLFQGGNILSALVVAKEVQCQANLS